MKKVIIVAYGFPPVGGAGVQRPVKFVKYLRAYGWEPVVLTVENPSVSMIDNALCKDIPENVAIYKSRTFEPSYAQKQSITKTGNSLKSRIKGGIRAVASMLLVPDVQVLWWPGLVSGLFSTIKKEKPSCLFVTAPPFSSLIPVVFVARLHRIPVVIDFRDEWAFSREQLENSFNNRFVKFIDRKLESYAVSRCTDFTAANGSYIDAIRLSYLGIGSDKGTVITNGFDEDDFPHLTGIESDTPSDCITITYTGTVWNATSLQPFIDSLRESLRRSPALREIIKIRIFGRIVDTESCYFSGNDLVGMVQTFGYMEHEQVVREIIKADIVLLTLSDLPGANKIITGKAFEYMAAEKHILAIVPEGETRSLVKEHYGNATVIYPHDQEKLVSFLVNLPENIHGIRKMKGMDFSQFSRKQLTGKLAKVFDKICNL